MSGSAILLWRFLGCLTKVRALSFELFPLDLGAGSLHYICANPAPQKQLVMTMSTVESSNRPKQTVRTTPIATSTDLKLGVGLQDLRMSRKVRIMGSGFRPTFFRQATRRLGRPFCGRSWRHLRKRLCISA